MTVAGRAVFTTQLNPSTLLISFTSAAQCFFLNFRFYHSDGESSTRCMDKTFWG